MLSLKHINNRKYYFVFLLVSGIFFISSCAYYNYFYNANKYYEEGEKQRREKSDESEKKRNRRGSSDYDKCIESAGRMLEYYPDSRWEDNALLLLAKAYYRISNYRKAIGKVDELNAKYPESEFILEGKLWKGISLLKISQPDSGRLILADLAKDGVPSDIQAKSYQALGEFYHDEERWEEASVEFRKVLDSGVEDEWLRGIAWVRIGECLTKLDKPKEAVELYCEILNTKPNRSLKLESTLKKATVLIQLERSAEALESLEDLLNDAAYINDFPQIEMMAARCLLALERYEDAKRKLQNLIETENRGELAAEANYEMGWIQWEEWHDLKNALSSLSEVESADRSSPFAELADSLENEMKVLYGSWYKLAFLESQIVMADSAVNGLRTVIGDDTTFIDSLEIITAAERKKSKHSRRSRRPRRGRKEKEEQKNIVEEDIKGDSLASEADAVPLELDSTALASLYSQRQTELTIARMELAGFHLFRRNDLDSADYYYQFITNLDTVNEIWGRATASLAFIAGNRNETSLRDSLYRLIYEKMPEGNFTAYAAKALGMTTENEHADSLLLRYMNAEDLWWEEDNPVAAKDEYLAIAEFADSSSDIRMKALLAAAYLSRKVIEDDTLALSLYDLIADEFEETEAGRLAIMRTDTSRIDDDEEKMAKGEETFEEDLKGFNEIDKNSAEGGFSLDGELYEAEDKIFDPDEVDELPLLMTSPGKLRKYVSQLYPDEIRGMNFKSRVEIEFVVESSSEIDDVDITFTEMPGHGFEEAAREVMDRLNYKPGKRMGRKVSTRMKQVLIFEDEEQPQYRKPVKPELNIEEKED